MRIIAKPVFLVVALALALAGCSPQGEAQVGKKLEGTWVLAGDYPNGGSFKSTIVVGGSGDYVCQFLTHSVSGQDRTSNLAGTFQIKDGLLIDTMTKHSDPSAVLPMTTRARIVRIDDREMVVRWELNQGVDFPTNETIFRKIAK